MVAPAAGLNPGHYLETPFNVAVSGRTITPVITSALTINGIIYLGDASAGITLTGSSEGAQYDLAAYVSGAMTYSLTTFTLGTTPTDAPNIRKIGTVYDYPTEGRCQALLYPSLAFQSDQYIAIESDGLHVKAFASSIINYGQIVIESPLGDNNLYIYTDETSAHINTPSVNPTDMSIFSGRNMSITGGGNGLGGSAQIIQITSLGSSWIYMQNGIHLKARTVSSPSDAASPGGIDFDMSGASNWTINSGLLTINQTSSGGLLIETSGTGVNSGNLSVQSSGTGAITVASGGGGTTITDTGAGNILISVTSGAIKIGSGSSFVQFSFSSIPAATTRVWTFPNSSDTFVGISSTQNISNKTIDDSNTITATQAAFTLQNDSDVTKQVRFQLASISTATTRVWTFPNSSDTFVGLAATQTIQNKTLDTSNSISLPSRTNLSLLNSWANVSGTAGFRKDISGRVILFGVVSGGAASTVVATLTSGNRPLSFTQAFACSYYNGTTWGAATVYVDTSGNITSTVAGTAVGSLLYLGNIIFDTV